MRISQAQYRLALYLNEFDYCEDNDMVNHDKAAIESLERKGIAEKMSFNGREIWSLTNLGFSLMPKTKICRSTKKIKGCGQIRLLIDFHNNKGFRSSVCTKCTAKYKRLKYRANINIGNIASIAW